MAIDPGFPVFLTKMAVDPLNGNIYPALPDRPYKPGELPRRFLTEEYCSQVGIVVLREASADLRMARTNQGEQAPSQLRPVVMETRDLSKPSLTSAVVEPAVVEPAVVEPVPHDPLFAVGAVTTFEAITHEAETPRLKINEAKASKIADALNGVGVKTAEKVVQEREAHGPFTSLEDMDTRASLPFGRNWEEFATQLAFD